MEFPRSFLRSTSFRDETSGGVARCQLFSQVIRTLALQQSESGICGFCVVYTAISRKVVGKVRAITPKGVWVVLSSLFFKEIWKNCTRGYGRLFASAKESKKKKVGSTASVRNSVLIISHITFRDCRVHISSDNLSQNSCIPDAMLLVETWYCENQE